ncbi:hypothetical protein [Spartinivicinus poritis]|uniref:Uncharacterized protein n=1 Tax=Spartinivicinus poritis TaxID=2994640 RepID=A0ABT5U4W2_9GAMM|nr:hypothetical protein [Spartinivicinus sp. A2-2]MDE1461026.1 hypothetical protein [Spartinivicinus sp. A2-2]
MKLHRFWFRFDFKLDDGSPPGLLMGCGVTAYNYDDALELLKSKVFKDIVPPPKSVEEDVDVSTLDTGHVLPNMGNVTVRGIWFPLGYE